MTRASVAQALILTTLLGASVALAGCAFENGPGGQSASAPGSLSYNGASTGSHSTEPFRCDGSAKVNYNTNLGSGSITIKVTDGSGGELYSKTVSGPGQKSTTDPVSGPAGEWRLTVTRGGPLGGFSGQYNVNVAC